jgi:hypothetical protein
MGSIRLHHLVGRFGFQQRAHKFKFEALQGASNRNDFKVRTTNNDWILADPHPYS